MRRASTAGRPAHFHGSSPFSCALTCVAPQPDGLSLLRQDLVIEGALRLLCRIGGPRWNETTVS